MAEQTRTRSKVSFSSVKSVSERKYICPWVAQWFNIPQAVVKILQFILGVLVMVFLLIWNSRGLTIANLNSGDLNYRNTVYGFLGIGALSSIYSVGVIMIGLAGLKIPAFLQALFSVFILVIWLILAPVMSASVEQLTNAQFIRQNGIDTLFLSVATGLGFGQLVVCLIDVFLGLQSMRRIDQESKEFSREMSKSRSIMMAVRSGQSFSEAKKTPRKSIKPTNETSPLKDHEDSQEPENQ